MNLLAPLDYPRQAAANLFSKLGEGDFAGAAPGLLGVAGGLASAPFLGPAGGVLLGSLLGGAAQGGGLALDEERFAAPTTGDLVEGLGGDRESFLQNAAAQMATDPLTYAGVFHGAKLGARALRPLETPTFRPTSTTLPGGLKGGSGVSYQDLVTKAERALPAAELDPASLVTQGRMPAPPPGAQVSGPEAMRTAVREAPLPAAAPSARDRMLAAGERTGAEHLASLEDHRRAALSAARDLEQDLGGGAYHGNPLLARLGVYGDLANAEDAALMGGLSPSMGVSDMAGFGSVMNDFAAYRKLGSHGLLSDVGPMADVLRHGQEMERRAAGLADLIPRPGRLSDVGGASGVGVGGGVDPRLILLPGRQPAMPQLGTARAAEQIERMVRGGPPLIRSEQEVEAILTALRGRGLPVDADRVRQLFLGGA